MKMKFVTVSSIFVDGLNILTSVMETPQGCIVKNTTVKVTYEGDTSIAESMVFVPHVKLEYDEENGSFDLVQNW